MVLIHALVHFNKGVISRSCFLKAQSLSSCMQNHIRFMRGVRSSSSKEGKGKWPTQNSKLEPVDSSLQGLAVEGTLNETRGLIKPLLFTLAFSSASFSLAAIWEYENIRQRAIAAIAPSMVWIKERMQARKNGQWRNDLNRWWNGLTEGQRVFFPILFGNLLVFLAWRIPKIHPTMIKYFCSNPASSVLCWPMVLSTFSHYSGFHLFANMFVLYSFSTGTVANMGKEQFLGFYLASGVIASYASYLYKVIVSRPGLSLGASGAIMGVLGYTCTKYPDLELNIIFLPFFTFKAATAIKVIMGIDAAGVLMGWKLFDHAAHLGGALFGIIWSYWGSQYIWQNRQPLVQAWHKMRVSRT